MRVTNKMLVDNLLVKLQNSLRRVDLHQEQIATGKRINRPSDDPEGTARVLRLRELIADNSRFLENIEDGQHWLTATEAALADSVEILAQLRSKVVQAQNDTLTADERRDMAKWAADYLQQLVQVANRQEQGKYVFGGTQNATPPYALTNLVNDEAFVAQLGSAVELAHTELSAGSIVVTDGGGTTFVEGVDYEVDYDRGTITALAGGAMSEGATYYVSYRLASPLHLVTNPAGITGEVKRQIGDGAIVTVNVRGPEAYAGDVDVFAVILQLKNALVRNDHDAMRQGLEGLDLTLDQVLAAQAWVGLQYDHLSMMHDRLSNEAILLQRLLSQVADTDVAEAVVRLQEQRVSYQAALGVTASISQMSLLNYLD
ncbi:MAG: flagellar hook-associated protein FlgL [bacterium]|jgi:flagellar hook-associated protein 3 FlgL|nr:flagellar hook-associated protein FlgL [candidate division KSB1 bacterium]MDH7559314.1 flagellar hook-associated protein FlgL [bacterium]